jgi:hypothetical protein
LKPTFLDNDNNFMKNLSILFCLLFFIAPSQRVPAATPSLAYDGKTVFLSAENGSLDQVLQLFRQQTGLEYDIPAELRAQRLPLVEIKGLTVKDALLKVLEGTNYDYILMAVPDNPGKIARLMITGKSTKISAAAPNRAGGFTQRINQPAPVVEDPFGGNGDAGDEDGANAQSEPSENMPAQGAVPVQPGAQPGTSSPTQPALVRPLQQATPMQQQQQLGQPLQPFSQPLQQQQQLGQPLQQQLGQPLQQQQLGQPLPQQPGQPQVQQPFPPNNNQNNRRSPF